MITLYCTRKLRNLLGFPENTFDDSRAVSSSDWYANLLWTERRKGLLVTHSETLYCLFVPDVKKADLKAIGSLLQRYLYEQLLAEGLGELMPVLMQDNSIRLAKAWDRRVIGSMTDQAKHLQFYLEDEGGLAAATIPALMMRLNRMPMKKTSATSKAGDYIFPSDEIRNVLGHAN